MAGSWNHITDAEGRFDGSRLVHENGGDVVEALEECYGMVYVLAESIVSYSTDATDEEKPAARAAVIEVARQHYKDGLKVSPGFTANAARQNINHDKAWGTHTPQPYTEKEN